MHSILDILLLRAAGIDATCLIRPAGRQTYRATEEYFIAWLSSTLFVAQHLWRFGELLVTAAVSHPHNARDTNAPPQPSPESFFGFPKHRSRS